MALNFNPARLHRLNAPSFRLRVNRVAASRALMDRLVSINLTLNNGQVSDQLSLTLDDRAQPFGGAIFLPEPKGTVISLALGYEGQLIEMGDFLVNHINLSGSTGGRTMTIAATPHLLYKDLSRTWAAQTLGDIVGAIAREHKLTAVVGPALKKTKIDAINQQNESNAAFLSRLAERYNAVCKTMAGRLLFMLKGEGTSASAKPMPATTIPHQDIIHWSKSISKRENYVRVGAHWRDYLGACDQEAYFPDGNPAPNEDVLRLPHSFPSKGEAEAAAQAKFHEVNRDDVSLSLSLLGNPTITAEAKIVLSGIRGGVDGEYIVSGVTHSLSRSGFQTSLEAYEQPNFFTKPVSA